jgi:succinate-semialdehyde dehydrogenase/glutarate-semialdehyde dehydrogenase
VLDPATGLKLADVANLGPADAQAAIAAANAAWPAWRGKTAKERSNILRKWFDLLMANQDDLGRMMTAEQGKPLPRPRAKWPMAPASSNGLPKRPSASTARPCRQFDPNATPDGAAQPIGVCAAITPWNFPLAMITRKVAPALAAGCPVIIKPAELTPLTALAAAELAIRAGIPAGVLNMLCADSDQRSPSARCCAPATWCATSASPAPPKSAAS